MVGVGLRNRLVSFAFKRGSPFRWWVSERPETGGPPDGSSVFLDSGAFSALTQNITIDLDTYIKCIHTYKKHLDVYASLDVIGDAKASQANTDYMESCGLWPLPTFHRGSKWTDLHYMCERYDHFALGGVASETTRRESIQPWLDGCLSIIKGYWPRRIHGFGIQAQWALERYPFYSSDSSSVVMAASFGGVNRFQNGKYFCTHWKEYAAEKVTSSIVDTVEQSAYIERERLNAIALVAFEKHLTELWRVRGVDWDTLS
jgi:hypothetical protein|tara:strand:- start:44100 stop:44876 length:777 start_codon:yes stop_codon:yes gene_type:complete